MTRAAPPPKLQQKPSQEDQSARFKKTARELGCDETPGALDRAFGKIEPKRATNLLKLRAPKSQ